METIIRINFDHAREIISEKKARSAWDRGVNGYALNMIDDLEWYNTDPEMLVNRRLIEKALLNGARNWQEYSYGGAALCYDRDIAKALCAPWELKKTRNGDRNPNSRETWFDVQERALFQASRKVIDAIIASTITLDVDVTEDAEEITETVYAIEA